MRRYLNRRPNGPIRFPFRPVLTAVLFVPLLSSAQDATTGALNGVVLDPAGAAVPGATVRLQGDGTSANTHADAQGEFLLTGLTPGTYTLSVVAGQGFGSLVQPDITIQLGRTARVLATVPLGSVASSITVRAATLPAGVTRLVSLDSALNQDITPAEMAAVPMDGRQFQSYGSLTPLVSISSVNNLGAEDTESYTQGTAPNGSTPDAEPTGQLQVRGADPVQNTYTLEGTSLTRAFDGAPRGGALPFTVPLEGVREFQVRSVAGGGGSGMLGRNAGGSVTTVLRTGTEQLHGTAFLLLRNSVLAAANPFSVRVRYNDGAPTATVVKPRDQREQLGASAGGALVPHRVFGLVTAEAQRRSFPAISSPLEPGFYSLSPGQMDLLANRGVSSTQATAALSFLDSLTGELPRQANELALLPRLDWSVSPHLTLTLAWAHTRFTSPFGSQGTPVVNVGRGSLSTLNTHTDTVLLRGGAVLSVRWTADLHGAWSHDLSAERATAPLPQEPHTAADGASPAVRIEQGFSFGSPSAFGSRRLPEETRTEAGGALHFAGLAHTLFVAADASTIDERVSSQGASQGSYDYTSGITGGYAGGLVDFITDDTYNANAYPNGACPSIYATRHDFCFRSFVQTFGAQPETRFSMGELSVSAGDHWRPTSRVRVDLNTRYEYTALPSPQNPNAALDTAFGPSLSTSHYPSDTNNLAPSLGVAYAVTPDTVVLAGYGYRFGRIAARALQTALENTDEPASLYRVRFTPSTEVNAACTSYGSNFGYPATYRCPVPEALADTTRAVMFSRGFQLPAAQTLELTVEHQTYAGLFVSVSYAAALSRELTNTRDANIATATQYAGFVIQRSDRAGTQGARNDDVFYIPQYTARLNPAFGPVTALESNGNGTYHGGVLQVEQRSFHRLSLHGMYTFSKALDTVRASGPAVNENSQFDPFQPLYDKAPSNSDRRQRLVAFAVLETRTERRHAALRNLAQNWTVAPLWIAESGAPFSYEISGGSYLSGGRYSLNGSGGANYLPSVGRNTLRLPWTQHLDMRVAREFLIRERMHLRGSVESFNLLNHVNVTGVQQRAFVPGKAVAGLTPLVFQDAATISSEGLSSLAFGTPAASSYTASRERRVQFGVRMEW